MAVVGFQTRTAAALSAELNSRAFEAAVWTAARVQDRIRTAAEPYRDTGQLAESCNCEAIGGPSQFGAREVGVICTASAEHAEWIDKGTDTHTRQGGDGFYRVGKRAPNRRNAPARYKGVISFSTTVRGITATNFFTAPGGVPLTQILRNTYSGRFRRSR